MSIIDKSDEEIIKFISKKKNEPEWMLTWRLDCYKKWLKMSDPQWANIKFPKVSVGATENIIIASCFAIILSK